MALCTVHRQLRSEPPGGQLKVLTSARSLAPPQAFNPLDGSCRSWKTPRTRSQVQEGSPTVHWLLSATVPFPMYLIASDVSRSLTNSPLRYIQVQSAFSHVHV